MKELQKSKKDVICVAEGGGFIHDYYAGLFQPISFPQISEQKRTFFIDGDGS